MRAPLTAVLFDVDGTLIAHAARGSSLRQAARDLWRSEQRPARVRTPAELERRLRGAMLDRIPAAPRRLVQTLEALGRRVPLAVVSDGAERWQREKLARTGLAGLFRTVVTSGRLGARKPSPALILEALRRLSTSVGEGVVVVGDDPVRDIAPARRLGASAIWIGQPGAYPADLPPPTAVAETLAEALERLA